MDKVIQRFKVNISKGVKDYYEVFIFDSKLGMKTAFQELGVYGGFEAITHSWMFSTLRAGKVQVLPNCGIIGFHKGNITPAVISHEMTHAANHYWKNHGKSFNLNKVSKKWFDHDEVHATMQGYMVNEFWKQYKGRFKRFNIWK